MTDYVYRTKGTCSRQINIKLDEQNNKVISVEFVGGCDGNTKGISSLVCGMDVDEVIHKLKGTDCRNKGTSCPDQLALALEQAKLNKNQ